MTYPDQKEMWKETANPYKEIGQLKLVDLPENLLKPSTCFRCYVRTELW